MLPRRGDILETAACRDGRWLVVGLSAPERCAVVGGDEGRVLRQIEKRGFCTEADTLKRTRGKLIGDYELKLGVLPQVPSARHRGCFVLGIG